MTMPPWHWRCCCWCGRIEDTDIHPPLKVTDAPGHGTKREECGSVTSDWIDTKKAFLSDNDW